MSDYRGPITGPGDEPPDVVPRTGPPTSPAVRPQTEPKSDSDVTSEPPEAPIGAAAEAAEMPTDKVPEATVPRPAAESDPLALETLSVPRPSEGAEALEPQLPDIGIGGTARADDEKANPAAECAGEELSDLQREEILEKPSELVRDVLVIDPTDAVPERAVALSTPDSATAEKAPPPAASETEEPQQDASGKPLTSEAGVLPFESLATQTVEHPAEPAAETVAETEAAVAVAEPPLPATPPSLTPGGEEPPAATTATQPLSAESAVEAQLPPPPLPFPQTIPAPVIAAPAIVEPLVAPKLAPQAAPTTAISAASELRAPSPIATPRSHSAWPGRLRRLALILAGLVIGYVVLVLTLIVAYRWIDPPRSALMVATRLSGQPVLYAPVPLNRISSHLQRAVVTSEDARFCYHRGVDWAALYEAMSESRGGSTITMQTAKNLFLWPSRSYIRKAIEIPVAMTIDAFWPKRRILEVYLNIAEWGPGIFGAEAAAHYHFDKPASRLTAHEATLLAASLPNPIARDAGEPGRITEILASRLRARLGNSDAFVRCLGLRTMRPTPAQTPRKEPKAPQKAAPKAAGPKAEPQIPAWRTTTDPAFNPWQN